MRRTTIAILASVLVMLQALSANSFEVGTHSALSNKAVSATGLDTFLKQQLSFSLGIDQPFSDGTATRTVLEWVQFGSVREDDGIRPGNHFHNPLRTWDSPLPFPLGFSSIIWGQGTGVSNEFRWQNARVNYFNGLVASTLAERERLLALAFETLGHQIHLVQDAAAPAHTRNDQHPLGFTDGFHVFAEMILLTPLFDQLTVDPVTGQPTRFAPSILALPQNLLAPIPIARIIDTTDPDQVEAVPSTATNIGIAEYSNANFMSDGQSGTIFTGFVFPRVESLDLTMPEVINGVTYFPKVRDGEEVKRFVAQDTAGTFFLSQNRVPDSLIFTDYGQKLLPRAVGYSAGLIDYFFRGRLEIVQASEMPTTVRVKVRNVTPGEDTKGTGQIVGVVQFMQGGVPSFAVSPSQIINLTGVFQEVVFDFSQSPIPPDAFNLFLLVVYRGPLALEEGAVIAKITCLNRLNMTPGTFDTIDFPAANFTRAFGVNNCGEIAGDFEDAANSPHGFLVHPPYTPGDFTIIDVDFPGAAATRAGGINDSGDIVGTFFVPPDFRFRGFLRSQGVFTQILFPGARNTTPSGINNAGQIVGGFNTDAGTSHGFLAGPPYTPGDFTRIDVPFPGANVTGASGINDAGQIVGSFSDPDGFHGFLARPPYTPGDFTSIDVPFPGARNTRANRINNAGQIVGEFLAGGTAHGFLALPPYSLNDFTSIDHPDGRLTQAFGINDAGQIVGSYVDAMNRTHGFLFNSVNVK